MIIHEIICDICENEINSSIDSYGNITPDEGINFDGEDYCDDCMCDNLTQCDGCYNTFSNEDVRYSESRDASFCESCYPEYNFRELNGYHESPEELTPLGGDWSSPLLGLELEMENTEDTSYRGDLINAIVDITDEDVFFQRDGSLDNGVELITMPATLAYHMERMQWSSICDIAKEHGFRSHDTRTCGIHIHASRYALADNYEGRELVIAKLMIIIEKHWDHVVNFSRRDMSRIEQWAKKPSESFLETDTIEEIIEKSKYGEYDRYTALNLRNDNTIEFRFFRGTLNHNTLIASLQLVETLIKFCQNNDIAEIFKSSFREIIASDYDELNEYIQERGL